MSQKDLQFYNSVNEAEFDSATLNFQIFEGEIGIIPEVVTAPSPNTIESTSPTSSLKRKSVEQDNNETLNIQKQTDNINISPTFATTTTSASDTNTIAINTTATASTSATDTSAVVNDTTNNDANGKDLMFCTLCEKFKMKSEWATKGCTYMKMDYINRHRRSPQHRQAIKMTEPAETIIKTEVINRSLGSELNNTIMQMRNLYFLSQHNLDINIFPGLVALVNYQKINENRIISDEPLSLLRSPTINNTNATKFQTVQLLQQSSSPSIATATTNINTFSSFSNYIYTNPLASYEFLKSVARPIEEAVIKEINSSSCWSLLVDESNIKASSEKTLTFISKHMVNDIPILRYLGMMRVGDSSSESLFEAIEAFILDKGLNKVKLAHFGSDGASTIVLLKKRNPYLTSNHCIAQRVHLALEDAANQVSYFENYKSILKGTYTFFSSYYKRIYELKGIREYSEQSDINILNNEDTQWVSWITVVHNFNLIIDDIKLELQKKLTSSLMAKFLHDSIDTQFIIATKFLADMLGIIHSMVVAFQTDCLFLGETEKQLLNVTQQITDNFIGSENSAPRYGTHLASYITLNLIQPENLPAFIKKFSETTIYSLKNRFPDCSLYSAMRILDPREIPIEQKLLKRYGEEEIKVLIDFYGKQKYNDFGVLYSPFIEEKIVLKEWKTVKNLLVEYKDYTFLEGWKKIRSINTNFQQSFPNITKLIEMALILPISNTELENVTDVGPSGDEYEWHFKVKCSSCNELNENWVGMNRLSQNEILGSRGTANLVIRCKFCRRESSAQIDPIPTQLYTIENNGKFVKMLAVDCRGLELVDFEPRMGFKATGVDSKTLFEDIDLTEGIWADYDEKAGVPVGISEIETEFKRV
ncbi:12450_t:CDS:10 [Entrophospora sp. SA101]|nr:12450_t:CDS:10 [Entrophospora sp. SA101]